MFLSIECDVGKIPVITLLFKHTHTHTHTHTYIYIYIYKVLTLLDTQCIEITHKTSFKAC